MSIFNVFYFRKESSRINKASLLRALNLAIFGSSAYIVFFATLTTYYFHGDGPITMAMLFEIMAIFFVVRIETMLLFPVAVQLIFEAYIGCGRIQVCGFKCFKKSMTSNLSLVVSLSLRDFLTRDFM